MTERKIALSIEDAADYTGIGRNTLSRQYQEDGTGRTFRSTSCICGMAQR